MKLRISIITALVVLFCGTASAQGGLYVDVPKVVAVGETFKVDFTAEGDKVEDFVWEPGNDFELLWGPVAGSSTSIVIQNGKRTKTVTKSYSYVLSAKAEGRFVISSATAVIDGTPQSTSPITIEVISSASASQSSQSSEPSGSSDGSGQPSSRQTAPADQDVFMTLSLSRTSAVVGEPIIATLKLYTNVDLNGFESVSFPTFNGFWSQEIEAPVNLSFQRENVGGRLYQSALLRRYMLIPQQSGPITIDPAEMVAVVVVRSSPRATTSIFDSFFDNYQPVRKRISTKAVTVNVSALPGGAPSSFGGGVGTFSIKARLSADTLRQHEAASLTVEVSGKGNIALIDPPQVNFPSDFEVYDMKAGDAPAPGALSGTKRFEYPFIPRASGTYTIPSVEYSYYDISSRKYVTLRTDPIQVSVARNEDGQASSVPFAPGRQAVKNLNEDIRFIATGNPHLKDRGNLFVRSAAFPVLAAVLILIAAAAVIAGRKIEARERDVRGMRNRKATKMALKRLNVAEGYLRSDLSGAFYEELYKALLGYVSDKLMISASEMSRDNISAALSAAGAGQEAVERFTGLLEACEMERYSPVSGNDAMKNRYSEAVNVISMIDGMISGKKSSSASSKVLAVMLLLVSAAPFAGAADLQGLWEQGNSAYSDGNWQQAIDSYEAIVAEDAESAPLYYNLGNAYFKSGSLSRAILNYERALKLDPSYEDAAVNLEMVRQYTSDRIEEVPEFILARWIRSVRNIAGADTWAWMFIVLLALSCAAACIFLLSGSRGVRKSMFITFIPLAVLSLCSLGYALSAGREYSSSDRAVVTAPVSAVRSSPSDDNTKSLFLLHEGTSVDILEDLGSWKRIGIADGRQGWMASGDMEVI